MSDYQMDFEILIPGQHTANALKLLDYVHGVFECSFPTGKKIAKEIAKGKYWEAYYCQDETRQEYWRIVLGAFDSINSYPQ